MKLAKLMHVQLAVAIIIILTIVVLTTCVFRESMKRSIEPGLELTDMYPKQKISVRDIDVTSKDECIKTCGNVTNCNAVQYYHPGHKRQANKCRMIRIEDEDDVGWTMSGSSPMTTIIVKKVT